MGLNNRTESVRLSPTNVKRSYALRPETTPRISFRRGTLGTLASLDRELSAAGFVVVGVPAHGHSHLRGAVAAGPQSRPPSRALVRQAAGGELLPRSSSAGVNDERLILVVEDDDATRSFLLDNLAADGFRVAGASSPQEGVRAIEVRQPSLVVLDLAFANGSGLDLLDRLRAADGLASRLDPDLPVIVLTGRSGEADRLRSFARGADDHLNKPPCISFPRCRGAFGAARSLYARGRVGRPREPRARDCSLRRSRSRSLKRAWWTSGCA